MTTYSDGRKFLVPVAKGIDWRDAEKMSTTPKYEWETTDS